MENDLNYNFTVVFHQKMRSMLKEELVVNTILFRGDIEFL